MVFKSKGVVFMDQKTILTDTPQNLIKNYVLLLKKQRIPVERAILFGSYAKGDPKPWSDVDVCIVSKDFGKKPYEEMVLLQKLTINVDPLIEPHPYHPTDLKDKWDALACEINKYGITVG